MTSVLKRFERKFLKGPGCWMWMGAKKPTGYGNFYMNGRYMSAHRASWAIFRGAIPHGSVVCHSCDTPSCVNPGHLFLGTQKDNFADMKSKGRAGGVPKGGEDHPVAKLTWNDVRTMRQMRAGGAKLREIAEAFGVSLANASVVCAGKTWAAERGVYLDDIANLR